MSDTPEGIIGCDTCGAGVHLPADATCTMCRRPLITIEADGESWKLAPFVFACTGDGEHPLLCSARCSAAHARREGAARVHLRFDRPTDA